MEGSISNPIEKRIVAVTGGNKGIGFEICRQLASSGLTVILTARDEKRGLEAVEKLKERGHSDVVFHPLDVTDRSSIASFADFIKTKFGKLDILVNNAAIVGLIVDPKILEASKLEHDEEKDNANGLPNWLKKSLRRTYEKAEECFKTNYFGTKDVTETLIPYLQLSKLGRIINISSSRGQLKVLTNERVKQELSNIDGLTEERLVQILTCFLKDFKEGLLEANGWPVGAAYEVSKVLINAYTRILARKYPNLQINCVNPGFTKTDLNWNTGILSVEEAAKGPVMLALTDNNAYSGLFFDQTEVSTF